MSGTTKRPDEAGALLVKLKYIRQERDGRIYVRRKGRPAVRLKHPPGSEAFYLEYARAVGAVEAPAPRLETVEPETLAWLCNQHFASGTFRDTLKKSTQSVRRRSLLDVCRRHGGKRYRVMEERHVRRIMEEKAASPEVANTILKSLRALFRWAIDMGYATRNPARDVPKRKYKTAGFHTWTEDEIASYRARWPSGSKPRLAFELLLCTGARRQDAVRLGRQMVRQGWLRFTTEKTGEVVEIPVLPELAAEIAVAPKENMTFLVTEYGKPFSVAGFGMRFGEWCAEAGLKGCSAHGLRKVRAKELAEAGASEKMLNSWLGWGDASNEARRYTKAAGRKLLAARAAALIETVEKNGKAKIS